MVLETAQAGFWCANAVSTVSYGESWRWRTAAELPQSLLGRRWRSE
jgi:hypothetical protein